MRFVPVIPIAVLFVSCASVAAPSGRGDAAIAQRVAAAIDLYPRDIRGARDRLQQIGGPAVPHIVRALWCREQLQIPGRLFFISALAAIQSSEVLAGLIQLLSHWDPAVRADSAGRLAKLRAPEAVLPLTILLDDEAVASKRVTTDPHTEEPILVRDRAVLALEETTGRVLLQGGSYKDKAAAWMRWQRRAMTDLP